MKKVVRVALIIVAVVIIFGIYRVKSIGTTNLKHLYSLNGELAPEQITKDLYYVSNSNKIMKFVFQTEQAQSLAEIENMQNFIVLSEQYNRILISYMNDSSVTYSLKDFTGKEVSKMLFNAHKPFVSSQMILSENSFATSFSDSSKIISCIIGNELDTIKNCLIMACSIDGSMLILTDSAKTYAYNIDTKDRIELSKKGTYRFDSDNKLHVLSRFNDKSGRELTKFNTNDGSIISSIVLEQNYEMSSFYDKILLYYSEKVIKPNYEFYITNFYDIINDKDYAIFGKNSSGNDGINIFVLNDETLIYYTKTDDQIIFYNDKADKYTLPIKDLMYVIPTH